MLTILIFQNGLNNLFISKGVILINSIDILTYNHNYNIINI